MRAISGKIQERWMIVKAIIKRNHIILADTSRKAEKNQVNVHWWKYSNTAQNVGDMLSPVVVKYLQEYYEISGNLGRGHLYAIGSVIDGGYQNAIVWGSGVLNGNRRWGWRYFRKLDIRLVRGPESQKALMDNGYTCPSLYGDPAILMPLIYPVKATGVKDYIVVRHYQWQRKTDETCLSPITDDWKAFIQKLVTAKRVISSSLHGIILAESYGIPAVLLLEPGMGLFKYRDYYKSTGRENFPMAATVEEAITLSPAPIPDFSNMQKTIIDTFPVDMWEK